MSAFLAELERLEAAAKDPLLNAPGWRSDGGHQMSDVTVDLSFLLKDAAPALIALVRAAEAVDTDWNKESADALRVALTALDAKG